MYISTHTDKNINSATRNNLVDIGFSRRISCATRREASILSFNDGFLDPNPQRSSSQLKYREDENYFFRFIKKLRLELFVIDKEND